MNEDLMDKFTRQEGSQQTTYTCPNTITYIIYTYNKIHKKTSNASTSDNSVPDKKN